MKLRFALRFLLTFTILVPLWWQLGVGEAYRDAILQVVRLLSPVVNGWFLEIAAGAATFRRGTESMPFYLNLPAIAMGLMPLWSLIVATGGQSAKQVGLRIFFAAALYFGVDTLVVLAYPFFMYDPGRFKDTVGVFSGMVAFVVAPLGIWFVVTYPTLQSVWQIGATPGTTPAPAAPARREARRG
jgi:hypothetical protein